MKNKRLLALILTIAMALSIGLTGCGEKKGKEKLDSDQQLNLSMSLPRTFDWEKATDADSFYIINFVMDGLTRVVNDGKVDTIEPAIAEKWDTSEDGKIWTFHLRDAKWTDDKPVTAQHFIDGWLRLLNPDNGFQYASFLFDVVGAQEYNAGQGKAEDVGLKAVDDNTLEVTLKAPVPYFIQLTQFKSLLPVRLDNIDSLGANYGTDPMKMVFNGPFIMKEYVKGAKIALEKNPTYWDADKVKLQKVKMTYMEEEASRMQMFEAKQIDVTGARGDYAKKYLAMAEKGELDKTIGYDPTTYYLIFNCETGGTNKLFLNKKIRQAFGLALDREDYTDNVYRRGYPGYGLIPPALMLGDKEYRELVKEPFKEFAEKNTDPKALFKEGLKELGLDPEAQYTVKYMASGTSSTAKLYQEWFKGQWEKNLGVKIELDVCVDYPMFLDRSDKMEFDLCDNGWTGDFNDPETFFNLFTTGNSNNQPKWTSPKYDELYKKSKETADDKERLELYKEMETLLVGDECPIVPYSYGDKRGYRQKYVKGAMYPLFGATIEFKYAYISGRN